MMEIKPRRQWYKGTPLNEDGTPLTIFNWLDEPLEIPESEIEETIDVDVIVVGAGTAGVCAARGAVEAGATCVLFEKTKKVQARSGEFGIVSRSERIFEHYGIDGTEYAGDVVKEFTKQCTQRNDARVLKKWVDNCGATFDWYMEGYPEMYWCKDTLSPVPTDIKTWIQPTRYPAPEKYNWKDEYYPIFPCSIRISPGHTPVLQGNLDIAMATGKLTWKPRHRVVKLLRDEETGRMTGVIAQNYETDKYVRANCAKGVVLSTGGYGGNPDMLDYYNPWARDEFAMPVSVDERRVPGNCGDGLRLGMQIGGKCEDGPHAMIDHAMGGSLLGCTPYLCLDENGERFMNEEITGQQWGNRVNRLPGVRGFQIFDSSWPEQVGAMPSGHACVVGIVPDDSIYTNGVQRYDCNDSYTSLATVEEKVTNPKARRGAFVVRCDTIEELVAALPISDEAKVTAKASIDRYNELAAKGVDEDFYKSSGRLFPIENGPFYACQIGNGGILDAIGGLDSDAECRVRDENLQIIPGLYAAGNCQGNRFKLEYPMVVPGISHSSCITFGRIAGTNCAKGI